MAPVRRSKKTTLFRRRRKYKVGRYRKNRIYRRKKTSYSVPLTINPFPNTKIARHRYVGNITLSNEANVTGSYLFMVNSMYDPDYTGVGHQPYFRDEMAAWYTNYTVLNCYIKVTPSQDVVDPINVGIVISKYGALVTSRETNLEQYPHTKPYIPSLCSYPKTIVANFNARKFYHASSVKDIINDDSYKTAVGSNPSVPVYAIIYCCPLVATDTPSILMQVEMTFVTCWTTVVAHAGS